MTGAYNSRALVVDADPALLGLLEEWLGAQGCSVEGEGSSGETLPDGFDLVVVDVPSPRQGGMELLKRVAKEHSRVPILVLSSSFYPGIETTGAVARALGVAGVLPKPLARETLVAAVRRLLADA